MSMARGFGLNGKSTYMNVAGPREIFCNFVVDSTNGNGWGIRSPKTNGYIEAIFMNTSSTPGKMNSLTNPNPQAGYAVVTFKNNFNYYLGGFSGQIVPLTSTSTTSLTQGNIYTITSLGTTTTAQWQTAGVRPGFVPAVGTTFVAAATASLNGSGTVGVPGVPKTQVLTVVGDPNMTIANSNIASNAGAQVVIQFNAATNASTTTMVAAAPSDNTVVSLYFAFDGSSVTIDGL